jgi:hypothetical protein
MRKQTGIKQIQDIELKDFTWWINSVQYDWANDKAFVEVYMKETHLIHSRTFEFECTEEWTSQTALNKVLELETFEGSV